VGKDNPCRRNHLRKRPESKVIFQDRRIGRMERKDCGSRKRKRISTLIVVRVVMGLRSVGNFIQIYVRSRTRKM
jgi:hypothetical protein